MKIYVIASDQYNHLLPMYSLFFNKYWPGQTVTVLCYNIPKVSLPNNFNTVSIGIQNTNLKPVVQYFTDGCQEDYFILLLEDLFLVDHIDTSKVNRLEQEILAGRADKASFHLYNNLNEVFDRGNGIVEWKQNVLYRTNTQAAIWTKKYLLKHLHSENTWWTFETQHDKTMNDGGKLIFTKEQLTPNPLFDAFNVYSLGKLAVHDFHIKTDKTQNGLTHKEDLALIKQLL